MDATDALPKGPLIIVADDHPLFRSALRHAINAGIADAEIIETGTFDALMICLPDLRDPDLVVLDLSLPGVQGLSGLMMLRAEYPQIPVMMVSGTDDAMTIRRCLDFGAAGFMPKTLEPHEITHAISAVLAGEIWLPPGLDVSASTDAESADMVRRLSMLTPQQLRVLMMLSEGLLNKQIAYALAVSEATIKAHVSAILQKLGVDSRTQAVILASRIASTGWTPPAH